MIMHVFDNFGTLFDNFFSLLLPLKKNWNMTISMYLTEIEKEKSGKILT